MILAIGLDIDETFACFVKQALEEHVPLQVINLRAAVQGSWHIEVPSRTPSAFYFNDQRVDISSDSAVFCRMISLSSQTSDRALANKWHALISALNIWLNDIPSIVVNRSSKGAHNGSKPLHESLIATLGLDVPESVTSCDLDVLRDFVRGGPSISKVICGVRADTQLATLNDLCDFSPANGPVHLQRFVAGADVRIHVVGTRVIAQRVDKNGIDYRRAGALSDMKVFEPPTQFCSLLVEATKALELEFAGWDFKVDDDERYWCLEANPMPGYSPYDALCDGAISHALIRHLEASQ